MTLLKEPCVFTGDSFNVRLAPGGPRLRFREQIVIIAFRGISPARVGCCKLKAPGRVRLPGLVPKWSQEMAIGLARRTAALRGREPARESESSRIE